MAVQRLLALTGVIVLAGWQAKAQAQTVAEAPAQQQLAATSAAAAPDAAASTAAAASAPAAASSAAASGAPSDVPPPPRTSAPEKKKGKKDVYTGPNTIVELPATPMLDEQGMQRMDPDGKPMWNPPVKQQRDKKGHPLFDEAGKPVFQSKSDMGYDEHGKKIKVQKEKEPKKIPVSVSRGTMTVDGMTGKAALNYDIADLKFIYLYAPGIGVAIVSNEPFQGAVEQKNAFNQKTLTVTVGEHTLQLASDKPLLGKKPESAYVMMDRQFTLPSRFPVMGYGTVRKAPYQWPGSKAYTKLAEAEDAPPPPADLLPTQLLSPCPTGQMRKPAPPTLPGQTAAVQPCVPIKTVTEAAPSKAVASTADSSKSTPAQPSN